MTDDQSATDEPIHLAVIGGGLAGVAATTWAASRGARVTLFNAGLPLGGSCIHTEQLPARTLMNAASTAYRASHPSLPGVGPANIPVDLSKLSDHQHQSGQNVESLIRAQLRRHDRVEIVEARATFVDQLTLSAAGQQYRPDRVLLTPGSHSRWPAIDGLHDVDPWSIADLAHLDRLPSSLIFLETSHISLAYAQALHRLGSQITMLNQSDTLLGDYFDHDISQALLTHLQDEGLDFQGQVHITHAESTDATTRLFGTRDGEPQRWEADAVVIVDHRSPRIEGLGLDEADIEVSDGFITVDESLTTTNPRVVAAGDAIGHHRHPHAAAYDAVQAAHNAISSSRTAGHITAVPFSIYTDPQVAGVGWHEAQARTMGFDAQVSLLSLNELPAARAAGRSSGLIKLIRDARSDRLLGARLFSPNASDLIMELALAIRYGLSISDLSSLIHPPISMAEAITRAAQQFDLSTSNGPHRPFHHSAHH